MRERLQTLWGAWCEGDLSTGEIHPPFTRVVEGVEDAGPTDSQPCRRQRGADLPNITREFSWMGGTFPKRAGGIPSSRERGRTLHGVAL